MGEVNGGSKGVVGAVVDGALGAVIGGVGAEGAGSNELEAVVLRAGVPKPGVGDTGGLGIALGVAVAEPVTVIVPSPVTTPPQPHELTVVPNVTLPQPQDDEVQEA